MRAHARLTVRGARSNTLAIVRSEWPWTRPKFPNGNVTSVMARKRLNRAWQVFTVGEKLPSHQSLLIERLYNMFGCSKKAHVRNKKPGANKLVSIIVNVLKNRECSFSSIQTVAFFILESPLPFRGGARQLSTRFWHHVPKNNFALGAKEREHCTF
jgi:hypothetical protein